MKSCGRNVTEKSVRIIPSYWLSQERKGPLHEKRMIRNDHQIHYENETIKTEDLKKKKKMI